MDVTSLAMYRLPMDEQSERNGGVGGGGWW